MTQLTIFPQLDAKVSTPEPARAFGGATYDPPQDFARLNAQTQRVFDALSDGQWHTLRGLSDATGDPEASVSARLRDLRKPKFGGFDVQRERAGEGRGTYLYRLERP